MIQQWLNLMGLSFGSIGALMLASGFAPQFLGSGPDGIPGLGN
jgi:hypothetical protein